VPDYYGRLIGKRLSSAMWDTARRDGLSLPDFHLITGADNAPIAGLEATGLARGFPNGLVRADMDSFRPLAWEARTALVIGDVYASDGAPAEVAPRWVLRRQVDALTDRAFTTSVATELEFYLFHRGYEAAQRTGYRRLRPAWHRHGDHDLLVDGHCEGLLGDVRRLMPQSGIPVELSQGEGGVGQYEVALEHTAPLAMADRHVTYKLGVKQLAQRHGLSATFMAKVADGQPGSSCHLHLSLARADGSSATSDGAGGLSQEGRQFLAGILAFASDFCLLYAPYANSYRRIQPNSWAPSNLTWGVDNRTCLVRVCGPETARRFEFRLPGADANPYLALAALIASGLAGLERRLEPPPAATGDAYATDAPALPADLADACERFGRSSVARDALGAAVHRHLLALGEHERDETRRLVSDVDLRRGFEVA
jgi:glutamine synthetase